MCFESKNMNAHSLCRHSATTRKAAVGGDMYAELDNDGKDPWRRPKDLSWAAH